MNINASADYSRSAVLGAIAEASARTNVDGSYLRRQAEIESDLNPSAKARTSSATGLFQFLEQTWLGLVKTHGAKHGLGWASAQISASSAGRLNAGIHNRSVLELRKHPVAAAAMAAEFAADNRAQLARTLDRRIEQVDLYLAHFLGARGAAKFLAAHQATPHASAAPHFPAAAKANRAIFFDSSGAPRSFANIRARFAEKFSVNTGREETRPQPHSRLHARTVQGWLSQRALPPLPDDVRLLSARLKYLVGFDAA